MVYGRAGTPVIVVTRLAAPKGLVLIEDGAGGELPFCPDDRAVRATANCIAVRCAVATPTDITASDLVLARAGDHPLVFDGLLATPTGTVAVRTVLGATLLELTVPAPQTRVRIWANCPIAPKRPDGRNRPLSRAPADTHPRWLR